MDEYNECAICLQDILPENECITDCNHVFCEECLDEMFRMGKTDCPMCRSLINRLVLRDETRRIVRIHAPLVTHTVQRYRTTFTNQLIKRLAILGISIAGLGMFYFAYYVWDSYENLTETRRELKVCEETLRHSTQILKTSA